MIADRLADFERDGFLALPDFAAPAACDGLRAHAEQLVAAADPSITSIFTTDDQTRHSDEYFLASGDQVSFFFEPDGETINKIGHAQHDLDPVFDTFTRTPALAEVIDDLGYADPVLLQSMYIFKQPLVGGEVGPHDDHTFLWTDPPTVTGFWFALEEATVDNGCLWALPGGHRHGPRRRFRLDGRGGTTFDELDPTPYPDEGFVPLEAEKGTMIVLDGLLPHYSEANRSDKSRGAYTIHVIDQAAEYREDNWLQRPSLPLRGPR